MILLFIIAIVFYWIRRVIRSDLRDRLLLERQNVEVVWTIIPIVVLIFIALPSLHLLYLLDEVKTPDLTVKVLGRQWYWRYEYSDFLNIRFESHMVGRGEGIFRLLEVDNRLTLPFTTQLRFIVRATDVIHSWTIPVLGFKVDAVPGRLNQVRSRIDLAGVYYGQCSEICGANHSFMPIVVEAVSSEHFISALG